MAKHSLSKVYVFRIFFSFLFVLLSNNVRSQVFTDSNLPIVIITTDLNPNTNQPLPILDDPRVLSNMKIIKRPDGTRNYLTDSNTPEYLNYDGRINIEIRGSSSQMLPKKQYGLTTLKANNTSNNNVSLLGMPSENDWILNSLAFDPSCMRDYISYNLSRQIGNYAPRTAYCEVVINGEYKGLYILQEKIKSNSNRVNVVKIENTDIIQPNLSGGYITKCDKTTGGDPVAWSMASTASFVDFIHELPKPENVTIEQNTYIKNQFFSLESSSFSNNTDLATGYPSVIDVPSFIDFMLMCELSSNADAYQFSTFFHKDRGGKLRAGPIWDFNLTYGNDLFTMGFDRSKSNVWQFSNGDNVGAGFWLNLFNDTTYKCYLSKRWNELIQTGNPFNYSSLESFIDQTSSYISEAVDRENQKWGTIQNHAFQTSKLKTFLSDRITWMTTQLGSYSNCNNIQVPSLVISKINYNPAAGNDLEFIEIKNTGAATANLTGVYLKELGISYQFPANSTISANQSIYIASNSTTFQTAYGISAFGQFQRNLSNTSQKVILADGFGNTIDSVEYSNSAPWPDANGNGNHLQLINSNLDNSLASSWTASSSLSVKEVPDSENLTLSPNPVTNILTVESKYPITSYMVYDASGRLLYESKENTTVIKTDFSSYTNGIYYISILNTKEKSTKKIIKK